MSELWNRITSSNKGTPKEPGGRQIIPWRPWAVNPSFLFILGVALFVLACIIAALPKWVNSVHKGIGLDPSSPYMHFAWTVPPPLIGTAVGLTLTAVSFKVQRLIPWFSMARAPDGGLHANESVKLDYLDKFPLFVPWSSLRRSHWVVFAASSAALLGASLSTTLSPLMYLGPATTDKSVALWKGSEPGFVHWYNDLEGFYAAMTGMTTSVRNSNRNVPAASPWISSDGWAIGSFVTQTNVGLEKSANISATVPAIRHISHCETADISVTFVSTQDGSSGFNVTATGTQSGCIHKRTLYVSNKCCDSTGQGCCDNWGGDVNTCGRTNRDGSALDLSQQSFVFWTGRMVSQDPHMLPNVSVTICTPKYQLYPAVTAIVDSKNNAVLGILLPNDTIPDPPLEVDPLFNGSTFNGYALDWFNPAVSTPGNPIIEADRKTAIRTGLLTAIVFQGESYLDNNVNPYADNGYFNITNMVYSSYLSHVAHEVYFKLPSTDLASTGGVLKNVTIHTEELRLYVNSLSAYGSAGLLALLALGILAASHQLYVMRDTQIPEHEGTICTNAVAAREVLSRINDVNSTFRIVNRSHNQRADGATGSQNQQSDDLAIPRIVFGVSA